MQKNCLEEYMKGGVMSTGLCKKDFSKWIDQSSSFDQS